VPNTRPATDPRLAAIYCRNSSPTPAADTTSPRPSIMEWLSMYRPAGPIEMRPVGEIEFANGVAAMAARGTYGKARVCAGIVNHADLALGALVSQGGRLVIERYWRGEDEAWGARSAPSPSRPTLASRSGSAIIRPARLLMDPSVREGFARLAPLSLSFGAAASHGRRYPSALRPTSGSAEIGATSGVVASGSKNRF